MFRNWNNAYSLAVHKSSGPVTNLISLVRDIDNSLFNAKMSTFAGELKFSNNLKTSCIVFAAGKFCRSSTGDFAFIRAAP